MSAPSDQLEAIVDAALDLAPAERAAYLDQACSADARLRQNVAAMLHAHQHAPTLGSLPSHAPKPTSALSIPLTEKPGDKISHYKLLQQIGEGGCGVVYMAEQEQPVRRRVALKVIKLGMDTKQVIARFEAERQALALMDHPNIAKVLDAGATDTGRPYFVMELVRGVKITDYCDQNNLPTHQRLELFMQVCRAIQHAHQKGIIHRDIKPSNILVTLHDGVPVPKVIDFGIAKAIEQKLTDKTLFTELNQFIGTPAYMSPEQAEMSGLDIDTRSDIYSLGVLLYELLTGQMPFDPKALRIAGVDEMRRIIREHDPVRPSTKLSSLTAADQTAAARQRQVEPPKLLHLVRGDLDWIAMKCLEKDRARRYETANGLAADIKRHLNHEPVVACPPSRFYQFSKLVRRNKLMVAAAGAVAAALILGLGLSTLLFIRETRAHGLALREAKKSEEVARFLTEMLKGVEPAVALGRDTTMLREILDKTAERVGQDLANQPEINAQLRGIVGNAYTDLGDYDKAEAMHREALRLRKLIFGATNEFVAASLYDLGNVLTERNRKPEAVVLHREALAMRRQLFGNDHPDVANSLSSLADGGAANLEEAEAVQREALRIQRKLFHEARPEVVTSLQNLGIILFGRGKLDEAEAVNREGLAMSRTLWGNTNLEAATFFGRLSWVFMARGNLAEAEKMCAEAVNIKRQLLGNEHHLLAVELFRLAGLFAQQAKWAEAEPLQREGLSIKEKKLPDDCETHNGRCDLGRVLLEQKKYAEAEPLLLSGHARLKLSETQQPAFVSKKLAEGAYYLVRLYEATGRPDQVAIWKAEVTKWHLKQVEPLRLAADKGDASALNELAWFLATCEDSALRDGVEAVKLAEKAVAATQRKDPMYLDTLAAAYAETGDFARAVRTQKEAIALLRDEASKKDYAARLEVYTTNAPYRARE